jgi:tetratricopeptide (TPR) repeat protein
LVERQRNQGALRQADLFQQYLQVMRSLADTRPLLLIVDDLQWADDGSIRLLFDLGQHLAGTRILVLGLFRTVEVALGREAGRHPLEPIINEFSGVFGKVTLELDAAPNREFVDALIEAEPNHLSAEFRERLFHQAQGHALFTVELLREMREDGLIVLDKDQHWVETDAEIDWNRLPARVEAVIGERIGRLDPELRELLSVASVEGERFTLEAVARVRGTEPGSLLSTMNQELGRRHLLVAPDGIRRIDGRRISVYRFRHILFQRHLYERLNEIEKAHLHEQVGQALEAVYQGQTDEIALALAQHFREANLSERASRYFFQAGQQAEATLAPVDAMGHYEAGLLEVLALPPSEERNRRELQFQIAIGYMRLAVPAPGARDAFARALELAEPVGTTAQHFWATGGFYWDQHYKGEWSKWETTSGRCLALARESGDPKLLLSGLAVAAHGAYYSGDFKLAIARCEEFLAAYGPQGHVTPMLPGMDLGAGVLLWLGQALFKAGFPIQGLQRLRQAASQTREAENLVSLHVLLAFGSGILIQAGDYAAGLHWAEESLQAQAETGEFGHVGTYPLCCRGWCEVMLGRCEEGVNTLCEAVEAWQFPIGTAYMRALRAVAMGLTGRAEEGRLALEEAMAIPEWNGPHHAGQVPRLYGDLLAIFPEPQRAAAEAAYREAIDIARQQEARSDELNASTSLARLLKSQGRIEEAREVLGPVYGWFTEGHELPYLMEAKELLDGLRSL